MFEVLENTLLEWLPTEADGNSVIERVLWREPAGETLFVINIDDEKSFPERRRLSDILEAIEQEQVVRRIVDPHDWLRNPDQEYEKKHSERANNNWDIIKDIVKQEPEIYEPEVRGALIRTVTSISKPHLYKLLKRYWRYGKIKNAFLPNFNKCGKPGKTRISSGKCKKGRPSILSKANPEMPGINVDENIIVIFKYSFKTYFETAEKKPLKSAYTKMLANHFSKIDSEGNVVLPPSHLVPTFEQFKYRYKQEVDLEKALKRREGTRKYNLKSRELLCGSTGLAPGPGSIYQIDATIADVYLVSRLDRTRIIGRPVIYFCVDVFSRMIVGLHVALEGPSWVTGMMALYNAILDKSSFCKKHGINITAEMWPCFGLPKQITVDNSEFICINSDNLVKSLDVTIANCPPFRADWKGIVEQMFHKANDKFVTWLPGAVRKREYGEPNPMFDAKLDIHQFTQLLIHMALEYNLHHRLDTSVYPLDRDLIRDRVSPIPIELWHWGIQNRSGRLREVSPQAVMFNLMPRGKARVSKKGIKFQKMSYNCTTATDEKWFITARQNRGWDLEIAYDPRKPDVIYYQRNGVIEPCHLIEKNSFNQRFQDLYIEEIREYQAVEKINQALHKSEELQSAASFNRTFDRIVHEATSMTNAALAASGGTQKRLKRKDIKVNASGENNELRNEQAWVLGDNVEDKCPATDTLQPQSEQPEVSPVLSRQKSILDDIEALERETT